VSVRRPRTVRFGENRKTGLGRSLPFTQPPEWPLVMEMSGADAQSRLPTRSLATAPQRTESRSLHFASMSAEHSSVIRASASS
jgi:hypothetical protein